MTRPTAQPTQAGKSASPAFLQKVIFFKDRTTDQQTDMTQNRFILSKNKNAYKS